MNERITKLLEEYGLSEREIKIYLFLVGEKETTAYKIAKETKIHKSTCYDILDKLIVKGFVSEIKNEGKKLYSALEVTQTITRLKDRENILNALLPEVERVREKRFSKVNVLESRDSQKQFNLRLFNKIKEGQIKQVYVLSAGPSGFVNFNEPSEHESSQIFLENILKEIKNSKLFKDREFKAIWDSKLRGAKLVKTFSVFGENRFINDLPTKTTVVIYQDVTAFLFTLNNTPQVIEIENPLITEEMKAYFENLWKMAKR